MSARGELREVIREAARWSPERDPTTGEPRDAYNAGRTRGLVFRFRELDAEVRAEDGLPPLRYGSFPTRRAKMSNEIRVNPMADVRFGVLAAPGTEVRGRTNCNHPAGRRRDGEPAPRRWGFAPTEECSMCGAWRRITMDNRETWNSAATPRQPADDER